MLVEYDSQGDTLTVSFEYRERLSAGRPLDIRRILLYDENGDLVGVEFLAVSTGIDLTDVPHASEIVDAVRTLKKATTDLTVAPANL